MWNNCEQLRRVVHSTLIVGMTITLLFSLQSCIVQIKSVRVNVACTQKTFQFLGRSDNQRPHCGSVCQVPNILCEDRKKPFFCPLGKGCTFLKRVQNQFKMLMEMCIVLASFVSTQRNANLFMAMEQLRDPFVVAESVEPGWLFTKFLLCYKSR